MNSKSFILDRSDLNLTGLAIDKDQEDQIRRFAERIGNHGGLLASDLIAGIIYLVLGQLIIGMVILVISRLLF